MMRTEPSEIEKAHQISKCNLIIHVLSIAFAALYMIQKFKVKMTKIKPYVMPTFKNFYNHIVVK
jgi:hypothetical protein